MGTWGTGLYANDETADLRDDFKQVVRAPWDGERLIAWAAALYSDAIDVRLALADLFWRYGIDHRPTTDAALAIVEHGADLAEKRDLGMGEQDIGRRAKVLDALAVRWRSPNPRPWSRKLLAEPEPFVLEAGDCLVYPTSKGQSRNPYVGPGAAWYRWEPDGWGAAVVLGQHHRFDWFARYLVAVLRSDSTRPAEAAEFAGLSILNSIAFSNPPRRRVHVVSTSKLHLGRMCVEFVGRLPVDAEAVRADFELLFARDGTDFANDAWTHAPRGEALSVADPIARYLSGGH